METTLIGKERVQFLKYLIDLNISTTCFDENQ